MLIVCFISFVSVFFTIGYINWDDRYNHGDTRDFYPGFIIGALLWPIGLPTVILIGLLVGVAWFWRWVFDRWEKHAQ